MCPSEGKSGCRKVAEAKDKDDAQGLPDRNSC